MGYWYKKSAQTEILGISSLRTLGIMGFAEAQVMGKKFWSQHLC